MSRARIYARNLAANWIGYGANLLILFFMSPFVVHTLGDVRYGVWSLMMTMTGYLGLVEIGTRGGLGRFINYYLGKDDIPKLNGVLNTAMAMFLAAGVLLVVVAGGLAAALPALFPKIPAELVPTGRAVLMLVAVNVWMSFLSAGFRQILTAHERFELTNAVDLGVIVLRAGSTIAVLLSGHGLVLLAVTHTAASVLGTGAAYLLARRVFPRLELRPALVSRARFKELFGFSIWAFIGRCGGRLLHSADTLVIAIILGPKWVTYYAIGGMLLHKGRDVIGQALSIFVPEMIKDCAREDWSGLRIQFRRGATTGMAIGILLLVGMVMFGRSFIVLWMGPQFEISATVLTILAVSSLPATIFQVTTAIYSGLHRVRFSAMMVLSQGLANLGLTLLLVLGLGMDITGVAWGTFFPRILWALIGGYFTTKWIGLPLWRFLRSAGLRYLLLALAFACICWAIGRIPLEAGWGAFFVRVALAVVVYLPMAWVLLPLGPDRARLKAVLGGRFRFGRRGRDPMEAVRDVRS